MAPSLRSIVLSVTLSIASACSASEAVAPPAARAVQIRVDTAYTPSEIAASPGESLHLVFTRTSDEGCGQQIVFPDLQIRRDLPLDEPVAVDVRVPMSGRLAFTCGMDMYRGAVVVR